MPTPPIVKQAYLPTNIIGMDFSPMLPGESRCNHDMLAGQCAIHLGHKLDWEPDYE